MRNNTKNTDELIYQAQGIVGYALLKGDTIDGIAEKSGVKRKSILRLLRIGQVSLNDVIKIANALGYNAVLGREKQNEQRF